ncbi:hypothetical protein [Alienimonas sp. DA493]|uniref:hypothetical protein n=1 Tax=Alienimonas sp. DA493 TaxID=3373605 RepID=UPI0037549B54
MSTAEWAFNHGVPTGLLVVAAGIFMWWVKKASDRADKESDSRVVALSAMAENTTAMKFAIEKNADNLERTTDHLSVLRRDVDGLRTGQDDHGRALKRLLDRMDAADRHPSPGVYPAPSPSPNEPSR